MKLLILTLLFFHAVKAQEIDCPLLSETSLLNNGGLTMSHVMNPSDETLTVELVYEGNGWLGFGVSTKGRMIGSSAVIGLPNEPLGPTNPGKCSLGGPAVGAVQLVPYEEQTLTDTSITQTATHTTMKFTKRLVEDGELAIDAYGQNTFIHATGVINSLSPHIHNGAFTMKLTPCGGFANGDTISVNGDLTFLDSSGSTRQLWIWHGVLMAISWGILVPLAIGSSMLRDTLCLPPGDWLKMHFSINMFAIACMVASFGIAVCATTGNTADGEDPKHFSDLKHRTFGLVIFLVAFMQAMLGMIRPYGPKKPVSPVKVPNDADGEAEKSAEKSAETAIDSIHQSNDDSCNDDSHNDNSHNDNSHNDNSCNDAKSGSKASGKSVARRIWEHKHRFMGLSLMGLSWHNCDAGLKLCAERHGEDHDFSGAFWGVTGGLAGVICILYAVQISRR